MLVEATVEAVGGCFTVKAAQGHAKAPGCGQGALRLPFKAAVIMLGSGKVGKAPAAPQAACAARR